MEFLRRKTGFWIVSLGIIIILLNFLTMALWNMDIDVLGVTILFLGLLITVSCTKTMKHSKGFLTRRTGVWICITAILILLATAWLPMNTDIFGVSCSILFILGVILIAFRWKY